MNESEINRENYAGFWFRVIAAIVDGIISQIGAIIIVIPLAFVLGASMAGTSSQREIEAAGEAFGMIMGILIQWLYFTVSESSSWQATLGKKMFGLKVTDMAGNKIGFGKANARYWSKIISALILLVGFLMVAFTKQKQGLHDIIAGTLVIKKA
ncbi:RDD family protein [Marinobacterium weihaiense]|uniref:RDD family protein n=1 Tax=Marinobacterium weihaiense TaxID=2851016 RepID=A0ABS6MF65_9GAMM|nr:RDD family protein [Marinobacterium weihaiense]MBV0934938.1 RDD family protein [Marinobacterium weihaiense]